MKIVIAILAALFLALQYKLWFQTGGISEVLHLKRAVAEQTTANEQVAQRNTALTAEVRDLKTGQAAVEERARNDLGMVKPGEAFYQVIEK
jgi:cell division protein FtsB